MRWRWRKCPSPRRGRARGWRGSGPWRGPDKMFPFPLPFCLPPPPADRGEGNREVLLGQHGSPRVAVGDAGRRWDMEKAIKVNHSCCGPRASTCSGIGISDYTHCTGSWAFVKACSAASLPTRLLAFRNTTRHSWFKGLPPSCRTERQTPRGRLAVGKITIGVAMTLLGVARGTT